MPSHIACLRSLSFALAAGLLAALAPSNARTEALLLVDTDSGKVLHAENAVYPWHPASITKIMTTYVALRAVKEGRLKLDSLLTVSERALAEAPSKMGFPVGTQMTLDNAIKMMMVKSANDVAVTIAEGVGGSVEGFAEEMNRASQRLGMTQSHWVNPNGLPDDRQVTSARDMAILARAIIREFPQHDIYWKAPGIRFGNRIIRNYNRLIDRYPGADGMKTGFICASGYNLVATASRNGKRMIAVVLGAPSGTQRTETAAKLLERGFAGNPLSWLTPTAGSVDLLQPIAAAPPNLRDEICGKGRRVRTDHAEEETPQAGMTPGLETPTAFAALGLQTPTAGASLLGPPLDLAPIPVSVIPPRGVKVGNPEALLNEGRRKKRGKGVKVTGKGRKTAVINVGADSGKPAAKPTGAKPKGAGKPKGAAKPGTAKPASAKPAGKPKAAGKSAAKTGQ